MLGQFLIRLFDEAIDRTRTVRSERRAGADITVTSFGTFGRDAERDNRAVRRMNCGLPQCCGKGGVIDDQMIGGHDNQHRVDPLCGARLCRQCGQCGHSQRRGRVARHRLEHHSSSRGASFEAVQCQQPQILAAHDKRFCLCHRKRWRCAWHEGAIDPPQRPFEQ